MKLHIISLVLLAITACTTNKEKETNPISKEKPIGTLEVVAEMDINPGNVAVSKEGRIFSSIHPLRATNLQLVEITDSTSYKAFPTEVVQSTIDTKSDTKLDTPLGIIFDTENRLWVIDAGLNIGKTRVFAFDIDRKKEIMRFDIPVELAPKTSFVQDLAVDEKNGFVYLADFGNPGIIVVDIHKRTYRKISHPASMKSEDIDMIIDGNVQHFLGNPARIGLNPITLSADRETLFYGAMNGTKWYQVPTKIIRDQSEDAEIFSHITITGAKPISDGAATDRQNNHYFTNIQNNSIDVLTANKKLKTLKKDPLLDWSDNLRIHKDWLYIAVNQLHKSSAFTGGKDLAKTPFRILKLKFK
ncbi:hypothetical protein HN014_16090 [Aquimarina sp. TRL1]|uniref:L-dopachrome tautomerase-related protein n=1 Tax=Aquimarina sp. (strain TRL1) TaxID=2736252 RepID=UPI001589C1D6|nr:L-dopachrome tautomerase-related protein [Aquimarina sp. TRL1]QKX06369.1 hypothetical protein HN014_16090 [Aquimarina sp. TRL1]